MRTLLVLASALSLASTLVVPYDGPAASRDERLVPRMLRGSGAGGSGSGNGKRPPKDYGSGPPFDAKYGGRIHPGQGVTDPQIRQQIAQEPGYPHGWNPVKPNRPRPGESGVWIDHQNRLVITHYGDDMRYHGDGERYNDQAYPAFSDSSYGNVGGTQRNDQRGRSLNHVPAGYGPSVHRDENEPANFDWMDNGLTRNSPYGYNPNRQDTTNVPVPEGESAMQAAMFRAASAYVRNDPSYRKATVDNRQNTADFRVTPNRGPMLPNNNDGRGQPYHTTNENSGYRRRMAKRGMAQITSINSQISEPTTSSTVDLQQQYEQNLLAYQTVRSNATELLYPVINEILSSSNLTIIHDLAFSLLQIVGTPQYIKGPFMYGIVNFDWWEDQITRNMTDEEKQNNPNVQLMYAQNGLLIELYQQAWDEGTAAANATGFLSDLDTLASYLITNDSSVVPQSATTVVAEDYYSDLDYFYQDIIDELPSPATGSIPAHPAAGVPFPTGSGGQWLLGSATGSVATPSPSGSGSVPIDNGFLANPTVQGLILGNVPALSTGTSLPSHARKT